MFFLKVPLRLPVPYVILVFILGWQANKIMYCTLNCECILFEITPHIFLLSHLFLQYIIPLNILNSFPQIQGCRFRFFIVCIIVFFLLSTQGLDLVIFIGKGFNIFRSQNKLFCMLYPKSNRVTANLWYSFCTNHSFSVYLVYSYASFKYLT